MSWSADVAGGRTERLTLVVRGDRYLVELPQGDRTVLFVPDSGSQTFVVFERNGVAAVPLAQTAARAQLSTVVGAQELRLMLLDRLQIGSTIVKRQPTVVVPRNEPDAPAGDGLLPLHLFASVSFDIANHCLMVRW